MSTYHSIISKIIGIVTVIAFVLISSVSHAFKVPEVLRYDLTWGGIKAGEAVLEIKDNGTNVQFISRANSSSWVSVFYKVEDLVVSTLTRGPYEGIFESFVGMPYNYRIKLREGTHRRDKELIIDQTGKKVTYINHLDKEKRQYTLKGPALDPLSSFYYIRILPLEVGKSVSIDVVDSKKIYKAEIQVLKKEVIDTPAGAIKTILIKPIIKSEGIFSRRGDILIWLTDDKRRVPVMLKTKVAVGSVKAMLVGGQY